MTHKQATAAIRLVTVSAVIAAELYLAVHNRFAEALFLTVAAVIAWGAVSFFFSKAVSRKYFQQEIMRYLYSHNKKGKTDQIIQHFRSRSGDAKPEAIEEIVMTSLEALEAKSKIAIHNKKVKVT